jgi:hypothetical protein
MTKSAKQLDAEIEAALSETRETPAATGEFYYAVYPDDENLKLYGPYETWKAAAFAGYFHKSADERARVLRTRNGALNFFAHGVEPHDEDAIKALIRYPREFGLKTVKIVHRAPPMHASWKLHSADSRQQTRSMDWKYAEEDRGSLGR